MKLLRIILLLVILVGAGVCDYQLRVRVHSYLNPDSRCAACTRSLSDPVYSCCDNQTNTGECRGAERCDTFFSYCLRPLGQTGVECPVNDNTAINTAVFFRDTDVLLDVGDTVFGSANPFIFIGPVWMGFQFYLVSKDSDEYEGGGIQEIDSFAIDLAIEGGQRLEQQVYEGRFEIAEIKLSFEVVCTDNHSLPNCTACEPGSSPLCTDRRQEEGTSQGVSATVIGAVGGGVGGVIVLMIGIVTVILVFVILRRKAKGYLISQTVSNSLPGGAASLNIETNPNIVYGVSNRGEESSTSMYDYVASNIESERIEMKKNEVYGLKLGAQDEDIEMESNPVYNICADEDIEMESNPVYNII